MSVEADEVRYYAQVDRDEARAAAIECEADLQAKDIEAKVYGWLTERFGENVACALIPGPTPHAFGALDTLSSVYAGREHFSAWLAQESKRAAAESLED